MLFCQQIQSYWSISYLSLPAPYSKGSHGNDHQLVIFSSFLYWSNSCFIVSSILYLFFSPMKLYRTVCSVFHTAVLDIWDAPKPIFSSMLFLVTTIILSKALFLDSSSSFPILNMHCWKYSSDKVTKKHALVYFAVTSGCLLIFSLFSA